MTDNEKNAENEKNHLADELQRLEGLVDMFSKQVSESTGLSESELLKKGQEFSKQHPDWKPVDNEGPELDDDEK